MFSKVVQLKFILRQNWIRFYNFNLNERNRIIIKIFLHRILRSTQDICVFSKISIKKKRLLIVKIKIARLEYILSRGILISAQF